MANSLARVWLAIKFSIKILHINTWYKNPIPSSYSYDPIVSILARNSNEKCYVYLFTLSKNFAI